MSSELSVNVANLDPMGDETAETMVESLLASYGAKAPVDPRGYCAEMVSLLRDYPKWAGEMALRAAKVKHPESVPTFGQLHALLEEQVRVLRQARGYRQPAAPRPEPTPEERSRVADRIKAWADQLAGRGNASPA